MRWISKAFCPALLCQVLALMTGCEEPAQPGINYFLGRPEDLFKVDRVVFIELSGQDDYPGTAEDMTVVLSQAIQARRLFHVDVVRKPDPIIETLSLDGQAGFTMAQLRDMRRAFRCDAVLVGEVRNFCPHPRMRMGLYLRLLDVKNGRLLWGVDDVWDTTESGTEKRLKKFFDDQMRSGYEPMNWQLAMISPRAFEKFVAFEVAGSLPDLPCPQEAADH